MARKLSILVAVLALVAAACGGGDAAETTTTAAPTTTTTTEAPATTTTAAPATTTTQAPATTTAPDPADIATVGALLSDAALEPTSARFEGVFEFLTDGSQDLPPVFEMTFSGAFNTETESSQTVMDFGSIFGSLGEELPPGFEDFFADPMEMISIGTTSYIKWGLFSFFTGPDVEWIEFTDQDAGDFVSGFSFGIDGGGSPFESIAQLEEAGVMVEEIGTEDIRGVTTTHYKVTVDAETLAEGLPEDEAQELRETFGAQGLDGLVFDMYIGDDGLLYRYSFDFDATGIPDADGVEGLRVTFDIYDYNADIVIEAPENTTPGDELTNLFGSFLGTG